MRRLSILFVVLVFSGKLFPQYHTIEIPEFKNIDTSDKYPEYSNLRTYLDRFDILISLKGYSVWGPDENVKVLGHSKSGWYKIEINFDLRNVWSICYLMSKIEDSTGDKVWNVLKENHLFDMADERSAFKQPCPSEITDTIIRKGKKEIIYYGTFGDDMPEYEFEIITAKNYKKLYFYSPIAKYGYCPTTNELKWISSCIKIFEKYLGN